MAIVRNILRHVMLETAMRKRRCHHKASHEITKGMVCLVVVDERGSKNNYCSECAKPMLDAARNNLMAFAVGLGIVIEQARHDGARIAPASLPTSS